jgi:phage terminase small subunit
MGLSTRQRRFAIEYCADSTEFSATQAAIRAGYSPKNANSTAFELMANPAVVAAIEERQREIACAAALNAEWVLGQWRDIASADPNDLIYTRLECCRHCYGLNHEYQWTEFEYRKTVEAAAAHQCNSKCEPGCGKRFPPLALGGFGFTSHRQPNPDCPLCHGDGFERVCLVDTREVKGPARRLYAGVKKTKDGIQILMRDQDGALMNIAKYLGMLIDKRELTGKDGGPILGTHFTARDLTDDQIAQMLLQERE